jgi:hypothetical protein
MSISKFFAPNKDPNFKILVTVARTIQKSELAILLLHGKWGMPPAPLDQQF